MFTVTPLQICSNQSQYLDPGTDLFAEALKRLPPLHHMGGEGVIAVEVLTLITRRLHPRAIASRSASPIYHMSMIPCKNMVDLA
jgi:hypothetical protein